METDTFPPEQRSLRRWSLPATNCDFHGWTDDELQYFIHNNEFPPRIKMLLGTLFSDPVQSEIKKESSAESRIAAPGQSEGDDFPPRSF